MLNCRNSLLCQHIALHLQHTRGWTLHHLLQEEQSIVFLLKCLYSRRFCIDQNKIPNSCVVWHFHPLPYTNHFFHLKRAHDLKKYMLLNTASLVRFLWMSEAGRHPYMVQLWLKPTWLRQIGKILNFANIYEAKFAMPTIFCRNKTRPPP